MPWVIALTVPVAMVLVLLAATRSLVFRRARRVRRRMEERFGEKIHLIAGCGIVERADRVPGVLVLAEDVLAYESVLTDGRGEIELCSVKKYDFEDTAETKHSRARKYAGAKVLAVYEGGEVPRVFVIPAVRAAEWSERLRQRLGEPAGLAVPASLEQGAGVSAL
jgi:hypothetical protein